MTNKTDFLKQNLPLFIKWRRDFHKHPETAYKEVRTSKIIAQKLQSFGIKIHTGMAKTGVVGILKNGSSKKTIGLRADMDALPIEEKNNFPHKSINNNTHACGHDGHITMLLAAAKFLAQSRDFNGTAVFIFQPAEEGGAGAKAMIADGLFDKFPVNEVYAIHNGPSIKENVFGIQAGPILASCDHFSITVNGKGTHAAQPHRGIDPIIAASQIVISLQTIVSRSVNPTDSAVVSITKITGGQTHNVIPEKVELMGTCRTIEPEVRKLVLRKINEIVKGVALTSGANINIDLWSSYPPVINSPKQTKKAYLVAEKLVTKKNIITDDKPVMGSEDFAFMLEKKPGCLIHIGAGMKKGPLHNPNFDFNDDILPLGITFWTDLIENLLKKPH